MDLLPSQPDSLKMKGLQSFNQVRFLSTAPISRVAAWMDTRCPIVGLFLLWQVSSVRVAPVMPTVGIEPGLFSIYFPARVLIRVTGRAATRCRENPRPLGLPIWTARIIEPPLYENH